MDGREFDIIVYGASGFTGQFVVEELAYCTKQGDLNLDDNFKWAIAGRNRKKLEQVLEWTVENNMGCDASIIEADSDDYQSILSMCKRTKLVISVIGPYRFFGENVVKACVEAGTNYVDISGEFQFIELMQLKYHEQAKQKEICLVSACGWDSIPTDLGVSWTKKICKVDLAGCEVVVDVKISGGVGAKKLNYGTWWSAIYAVGCYDELLHIREKLYSDILPPPPPERKPLGKLQKRSLIHYNEESQKICLPFIGPDKTVVKRSQLYRCHTKNERPIHCETFFAVGRKCSKNYIPAISMIAAVGIFTLIAKFRCGRYLLEKYPGFFSFGAVSRDGVPRSDLKKISFTHTISGFGFDRSHNDPERYLNQAPLKRIVTKISGPDPGYTATSRFLVHAGITLLKDRSKLPGFGVLTPGAAFIDTDLINRLEKRDIKFELKEEFYRYASGEDPSITVEEAERMSK